MPTSKADRLSKLFERDSLPPLPEPNKSHIADTEIISKMQPTQQPWKVPKVAQTPRSIPRSPPPVRQDIEQLTSSDDDEYVRAFRKVPSAKPEKAPKYKKKTSTSNDASHGGRPIGKPGAKSGHDAAGKGEADQDRDDGVLTVDKDGKPLIGRFCLFTLVTKFCYKYMDDPNDRVSKHFFASGKIWNRTWDIYYIHPPTSLYAKPILLVPETQVQALLDEINSAFRIAIKLPRDPFLLSFYQDGTPPPIRLGISQSREAVSEMEQQIPPPSEDHGNSPKDASPELDRSFTRFKEKMERALAAQKKKAVAIKKAKAKDRLAAHVNWCEALRRGQRYLGLRPLDRRGGLPLPDPSLSWNEQQEFEKVQKLKYGHILEPLDVDKPAPHPFDRDVVFVSVDVEAFERAHNLITEVGISTLDTADIKALPPGPGGANWMEHIRSRHFRISNHEHLRNTMFCTGDPERFLFGRSEFVSMDEIGKVVDSCFEPPYSADFRHDGKYRAVDAATINSAQISNQVEELSLEAQNSGQAEMPTSEPSSNPVDVQGPSNAQQDWANKTLPNNLPSSNLPKETSVTEGHPAIASPKAEPTTNQAPQSTSPRSKKPALRTIILVGHDLPSDLQYLSTLPTSTIFHNPPLPTYPLPLTPEHPLRQHILESLDTAHLYQVWKRETNITSLARVLVGVGRAGWGLHNGGNDARYTLEGLVGVLVKSRLEEGGRGEMVRGGEEEQERLTRVIRDRQDAVEREERENAAMWRHAVGKPGSARAPAPNVLSDPPQDTSTTAQETPDTQYPWSHLPSASLDGGDPKPLNIPTPKPVQHSTAEHPTDNENAGVDAVKSTGKGRQSASSRRKEEILRLQQRGEIGGPCDWGVGGRDGW